ncbi:hypothetical protein CTI12_AA402570 [Artemisia annua]|uniref:Uncharacterized protein n=1 Tax=Artemisia annua TaxID=35608 RepID=A0A2U1M8T0_ARTAN|nr:hypothetical protein CTI12_AA402570 [Artemisia annua]
MQGPSLQIFKFKLSIRRSKFPQFFPYKYPILYISYIHLQFFRLKSIMLSLPLIDDDDEATCLKCNTFHGSLEVVSDHQNDCTDYTPGWMKGIDVLCRRIFKEMDLNFDNQSPIIRFDSQISLLSDLRAETRSKNFLKAVFKAYNHLGSNSLKGPAVILKEDPKPVDKKSKLKETEKIPGSLPTQEHAQGFGVPSMSGHPENEVIQTGKSAKSKKRKSKKKKNSNVTDEVTENVSDVTQSKVDLDDDFVVSDFSWKGKEKSQESKRVRSSTVPLKRYINMCLDGGEPSGFMTVSQTNDYGGDTNVFEELKPIKFDELKFVLNDDIIGPWRESGNAYNFDAYRRLYQEFDPQMDPAILLVSQTTPSPEEEGEVILWKGTKH